MNAIIVGPNGRPSITEMLHTFPFDVQVKVFTYRTYRKNNRRVWFEYDSNTISTKPKRLSAEPSFETGDTVVYWGTRVVLQNNGATVYNSPNKIDNASNKKKSRQLLIDNDVNTPILLTRDDLSHAKYPVIVRKDRHRGGIGFHICANSNEARYAISNIVQDGSDFYISEVYPKTEEYRVHCAGGKILLIKKKPTPSDPSIIAWNFHQTHLPWQNIERKAFDFNMGTMALNAVKALGLNFGAVDIMSKPGENGFPPHVVVEVNTAPSYTPYLIKKYGAYFNLMFKQSTKFEPWDYTKFKAGKSLAWKNLQLKNGKNE